MNTFLEKVMRSPKAASRIAAAFAHQRSEIARQELSNSGDMAEDPVRRMIGNEGLADRPAYRCRVQAPAASR